MKIKKIKSLKTFGISGTVAVAVAFLLLALLPGTAKGFTLIELIPCPTQEDPDKMCVSPLAVLGVVELFGVPCNRAAALAWHDYITYIEEDPAGAFKDGFRVPDVPNPPGIFFRLTPAPKSVFVYTYGNNEVIPPITATMLIRLEDLKKLPLWRGLALNTQHAMVAELNGRWDVMRASGPIGGFPGNLHFDINKSGVIVCVVPEYRN